MRPAGPQGRLNDGACGDGFDDGVVYADEDFEAVAEDTADGCDAANVGAGLFDGGEVGMFLGEFGDLFREKVGLVRDGVVVEHAGQAGGGDDG